MRRDDFQELGEVIVFLVSWAIPVGLWIFTWPFISTASRWLGRALDLSQGAESFLFMLGLALTAAPAGWLRWTLSRRWLGKARADEFDGIRDSRIDSRKPGDDGGY